MNLNNETQRKAWKQVNRILYDLNGYHSKRGVTKKISHPEHGAYQEVDAAKEFVKKLVDSEECPISRKDSFVFRPDLVDSDFISKVEEEGGVEGEGVLYG
jgi:hypothetical protein